MTRTDNIIAKLGLILVSLLAFSLYIWIAALQLLQPYLPSIIIIYLTPLLALILPAAGGILYLRFGRPERPRPLYLFIAVFLIAIVLSFFPDLINPFNPSPMVTTVMPLLGALSPAVLYLFILSLPITGRYIRALKITSAIFSGIVLIILCISAYFTVVSGSIGETPLTLAVLACLAIITPIYGFIFLALGLLSLKKSPLPDDSPQTEP